MPRGELETIVRGFVGAYAEGDRDAVGSFLADDVVAFVTNADAGADEVRGRDAYVARVPDPEALGAELDVSVTQVLQIDDERVMFAVEISARRADRELHNFAAFLARVAGGRITELSMVEAQPAHSDEFWA
jgi:ketosteroid isomerase-like protein